MPRSLADLKEADGIGEVFCRDYGAEVLGLMPDVTAPAVAGQPASAEEAESGGQ